MLHNARDKLETNHFLKKHQDLKVQAIDVAIAKKREEVCERRCKSTANDNEVANEVYLDQV